MKKFFPAVGRFLRNEEGATMTEYGIVLALLVVVSLAIVTGLGTVLSTNWSNVSTSVSGS